MGGGDKPLLEVAGRTMLSRILAALAPDVAAVAISANGDPARFAAHGLPVLPDEDFAGQGPLAGVLAGLDWAAAQGGKALLTVPGDAPFIPTGLATALAPAPACAESAGHVHHLTALWPLAVRDHLRRLLAAPGPRSVGGFGTRIGMRIVAFPVAQRDPFLNINTPEELAAAERAVDEPI